jgi:hypothetical protein
VTEVTHSAEHLSANGESRYPAKVIIEDPMPDSGGETLEN